MTASSARRKSSRRGSSELVTGACRACCVAQSSTVSLVEVSLSTVIELKDGPTAPDSSHCNALADTAASVKM